MSLRTLDLEHKGLDAVGMEPLGQAVRTSSSLRTLVLSRNQISDAGPSPRPPSPPPFPPPNTQYIANKDMDIRTQSQAYAHEVAQRSYAEWLWAESVVGLVVRHCGTVP